MSPEYNIQNFEKVQNLFADNFELCVNKRGMNPETWLKIQLKQPSNFNIRGYLIEMVNIYTAMSEDEDFAD
jgi:hypothetical protein